MFLNYAGTAVRPVRGPQYTQNLMADMTRDLPDLEEVEHSRSSMSYGGGSKSVTVESYGDYDIVYTQGPGDILGALSEVNPRRRPVVTSFLRELVDFYMAFVPNHGFVLACFDGAVQPKHPIVVSYRPHDPEVLTIPGLDGHDGSLPTPGAQVGGGFRVAFGIQGLNLPGHVDYSDGVSQLWAPSSVVGFHDNRSLRPNGDYVLPVTALQQGLTGRALAAHLV
jgi:hypothetical protein